MPALKAASYYVDYAAGVDTNSGTTTSSPWKHCPGDPAASGVPASAILSGADTVFFKGGVSYVFTGATGIALRWNGTTTSSLTYDGNSAGTWGSGRAKFTDNYGAKALAAFVANSPVSYLTFKSLDIGAIGGAAVLPADTGTAAPARFGAGIVFNSTVAKILITDCAFHHLGYAFNAKPMGAASIAGTGIGLKNNANVTITNCTFTNVLTGIELAAATSVSGLTVTNCTFSNSVCWSLNLPPPPVSALVTATGCTEAGSTIFASGSWAGYGPSTRTETKTVAAGAAVKLSVTSGGTPAAAVKWLKNGSAITGATNAVLSIAAATAADAGTYTAIATNGNGSSSSNEAILNVTGSTAVAPSITVQPASQTVATLAPVTFTVAAVGSPTPTYQWLKNGTALSGQTAATLSLASVGTTDAGTYTAVASNAAGSATSAAATLSVLAPTLAPAVTQQPVSTTVAALGTATFTVTASGSPTPTFQWYKNGTALSGRTAATLTLTSVGTVDAGSYVVTAVNSAGSATSTTATLLIVGSTAQTSASTPAPESAPTPTTAPSGAPAPSPSTPSSPATTSSPSATPSSAPTPAPAPSSAPSPSPAPAPAPTASAATSHLANVSVRGSAGRDASTMIVGFVVSGSASKSLLVRGIGPGLRDYGVASPLDQPVLSLFSGSNRIGVNEGWSADGARIAAASAAVGAFALANNSHDTALLPSLPAGAYTAQIAGASSGTGTALLELYDSATSADAALVNVSVRTAIGGGADSPIIGFVVTGNAPKKLLLRAVGPALTTFGVDGTLADPKIEVYQNAQRIDGNDNWQGAPALVSAFKSVGAFPIADPDSKDAALILDAEPGAYSVLVSGPAGSQGVVIVEVYELN